MLEEVPEVPQDLKQAIEKMPDQDSEQAQEADAEIRKAGLTLNLSYF